MKRLPAFVLLLLIASFALAYLLKPIADLDFFWHLASGRWMAENRALPQSDPFSYTTPSDNINVKSVLTRYWLSQLLLYAFYLGAGWNGIILLRFLLFSLLAYLLWKRRGDSDATVFLFFLLAATVAVLRSFPLERPHVFTFLFFAATLAALDSIAGSKAPSLKLLHLPAIMLLWSNMHIGFIMGQVIIATYIATNALKFFHPVFGRPIGKSAFKRLLAGGALAVAASFVNPNTYKGFAAYFYQESIFPVVLDWFSTVETYRSIFTPQLFIYWALLALCALVVIYRAARRSLDATDLAMLSGLGYYSFIHIKFVPLFFIYAVPFAASAVSGLKWRALRNAILLLVSAAMSAYFLIGQGDASEIKNAPNLKNSKWLSTALPEGAADFVLRNDLRGNMFNSFDWGGYLIWKLGPGKKVFVDNRILDNRVFVHALTIENAVVEPLLVGRPNFKALLDSYGVNYIITKLYNTRLQMLPLAAYLVADPEWVPVYQESNAIVFVKNTPANAQLIARYGHVRGQVLEHQIRDLEYMISRSPGHSSLYVLKGDLHLMQGDRARAREAFMKALELEPKRQDIRDRLEGLK